MGTALGWAVLGVVLAGFVGVVAMMRPDIGRLDAKIDAGIGRLDVKIDAQGTALRSDIGRLDAKIDVQTARIDAQTARIDHLVERVEEHLSTHHSVS